MMMMMMTTAIRLEETRNRLESRIKVKFRLENGND